MKNIKKDFPIFENNKGLIYLDSAATSQRPKQVIEAVRNFMEKENANVERGLYDLGMCAMERFNESRRVVGEFIGTGEEEEGEIVFTKNSTEGLNLLSYSIGSLIKDKNRNEILLSEMEHHSNLVPWQELAKRKGMKLKFIKLKKDFSLDYEDAGKKISDKTAVVSIIHVSNVLGIRNDVKKICKLAREKGALSVVDSAQGVGHIPVDVRDIGCDFLVFSSHKILGPMGVGVLYGRKELLNRMNPFMFGGGMIEEVDFKGVSYRESPEKFEAGTLNVSGIVGLASAIGYLEGIGMDEVERHIKELTEYCVERLKEIEGVEIYSNRDSLGIASFNLNGIHCHDVASLLNDEGIAVRAGHHCAMPLMGVLGVREKYGGVVRASFYVYNNKEDVGKLVDSLKKIKKLFEK